MLSKKIYYMFFVAVLIVLMGPAAAFSYNNQQGYVNDTGETANDLTKILEGYHVITDAIHDEFATHSVGYGPNMTVIHWEDGEVEDGEFTWACFSTASGDAATVIAVFWTNSGIKIDDAGPALGIDPTVGRWGDSGTLSLGITNDWHQWDGPGFPVNGDYRGIYMGPISGTNVYSAVRTELLSMEDLTEDIWETPSDPNYIPPGEWTAHADFSIDPGDPNTLYTLGEFNDEDVVLFRFDASGAGRNSREILQFRVGEISEVFPTGDITEDGYVDLQDFALLAEHWLDGHTP